MDGPALWKSTDYNQLFALNTSCIVYADMIMDSATLKEVTVMLLLSSYEGVGVVKRSEDISKAKHL